MRTNIIFDTSAMGIDSGSRQCYRKCRPVWDLQRQKKCRRKDFYICGFYFHNSHRCGLFLKD